MGLYEQERDVIKTRFKGWYCNKLPLIEETDEQRLPEQSQPLRLHEWRALRMQGEGSLSAFARNQTDDLIMTR